MGRRIIIKIVNPFEEEFQWLAKVLKRKIVGNYISPKKITQELAEELPRHWFHLLELQCHQQEAVCR